MNCLGFIKAFLLSIYLSVFSMNLTGQFVGVNTNNPTASLHVEGSSVLFKNGSNNQVLWNILGFETQFTSLKDFKFNTPDLHLNATNLYFNSGNISVGGVFAAQQQLDVNGGIRIGDTPNAIAGSLRYKNDMFEGHNGTTWIPLYEERLFTRNSADNAIISTNNHISDELDFIIGDEELPSGIVISKRMMFFDASKASFRVGRLFNSSDWDSANVGVYSFASGLNNRAGGISSFATGEYNQASGYFSTSLGRYNQANTTGAFVTGTFNTANSAYETVLGRYNEVYTPGSTTNWSSADKLFVIGNGSSTSNRNDLLAVYKNGRTELDGDLYIGDDKGLPSISLEEKEASGVTYGELLVLNSESTRADKRSILMSGNGSNNEPFLEMRRKNGSVGIILDVDVAGDARITTDELSIKGGSDFAEFFDISEEGKNILPGMLVSIDPFNPGKLTISQRANDMKLVGIISGANGVETGMTMGQKGTLAYGDYPIALTGRVYVYANEEGGVIQPGDFLTSSSVPGVSMKSGEKHIRPGTIIGKAMTEIDENGFVLVLVNLQ